MAEENGNNQQNNNQQQQSQGIPASIEKLATNFAGMAGLVKSETLAKLKELGDKKLEAIPAAEQNGGQKPDTTEGNNQQQNNGQGQNNSGAENGAENGGAAGADKKEEEFIVPVLGAKIIPKKDKKNDSIVIEKIEDFFPVVKSKYGQELKEVKDIPKFFESVDKWRADAQKAKEAEASAEQYKKVLEGLPEEILSDVRNFYSGKDYKKERASAPVFDFKLDADKQDAKKLVGHYQAGKLTPEQVEKIGTDEEDQATKIAIEASISQYKVEKERRDGAIAAQQDAAKNSVKNFNASIEGSMTHLKTTFPGLDAAAEAKVKQIMSGGMRSVIAHYFNEDGTFKNDAAERLLLAENGREVIGELMGYAERRAESKINEEFVSRGADGADKHANRGGASISPEAQRKLDELKKLTVKPNV